jgi:site-specific recombinase XerD
MNKSFSILFYLRHDKVNLDSKVPIYLRITIDSQKAEIATKRNIDPSRWDAGVQRAMGTNDESRSINTYLKTLEQDVYKHYSIMLMTNIKITANSLKRQVLGLNQDTRYLGKIFLDHNQKFSLLIGDREDSYSPATLQRYKTTLMHLTDFMKLRYKVSDIDIRAIDHEFITAFEFYLRTTRKCNNNSAVKYVKNFKKIIRICIANGWLDKDPFVRYSSKLKEVERVVLTEAEIKQIANKEITSDRLRLVRDIFIFSCYTGLAYSDVAKLEKSHISPGSDGEQWIQIKRTKTESMSKIPLLPIAESILKNYSNHSSLEGGQLLPILSNQNMNAYLKEVADICGIDKELTFHIARHSFATSITLNNNVPIESVSRMLGHKSLRTTQHYAKVLDKKVGEDMKKLKDILATTQKNNSE